MTVRRKSKGTREEPTLIPSMFGKRMVGCICKYLGSEKFVNLHKKKTFLHKSYLAKVDGIIFFTNAL